MKSRVASRPALLLFAALTVVSCGDDLTLPNEGQPAELVPVRGNGQNGTVGQPLADSLVVQVRDGFGSPIPSIEVSWTAEDGGSVAPATAMTDANGRAGAQRILGPQPGTYKTLATVAALPEEPVEFTTTGVASRLSLLTQPAPAAASGVTLERQPVLQLLDADANPVERAGVVVTVQIAAGGGSLGGTTSVPSDAGGVVTFTDLSISGSPGLRTLLFAADAFASIVSAPIAVGVGAATSIAVASGGGQSATVNTAVATPPAAIVRDANGTPVAGIPVTFSVASGGGSIAGEVAATGADGIARVGSWTLGTTAGENTLHAQVEGLELEGSPATFAATGVAGPVSPEQSTLAASPALIPASNGDAASTLTATARDAFGNPIRDLAVTFSATGSGNVLTQPQQPTDAAGLATGRLAATVAGARVVSASIAGQTIAATAAVTVTAAAPVAENSSASVGNGTAGSRTTVIVELKDAFGNPVAGAGGSISVGVTGANGATGDPASDQGSGRYEVGYVPRAAGTDLITVLVSGAPVPGGPLASIVSPGAASPLTSTAVLPAAASLFSEIEVVVTVRDAEQNVRTAGGDEVRIRVGNGQVDQVAQHNGDGTYTTRFNPPSLGSILVEVLLNGAPIAGSPFDVFISLF